jgi:hypothetical protein
VEATDGGIVHSPGSLARHFLPASEGAGQFAQVTSGGQERVPYSATYLFYAR